MAAAPQRPPWRTHESHYPIHRTIALFAVCVLLWPAGRADAQGVTTGAITGVVKDAQGAVIPGATVLAVHQPSGSTYEAVTQGDGRFVMPGMRVGGPYTVTASLPGFTSEAKNNISVSLGVTQDLDFGLKVANVVGDDHRRRHERSGVQLGRTGAATAVTRDELATLPTISGRITDITRLTPQYGGNGSFAGQDNRANNMTVDGSYFNNSFGLGVTTGGIGDRTGVAPISLEAIEQVQVSVAPYDVRQGNFTGAGINTVTRSGTNKFTASVYHRYAQRVVRRHRSGRPDRQSGHLHDHHDRRVGRRPDRQEQAVRVRRLRKAERHASADDVHVEPGRRAGRPATRPASMQSDSAALSQFLSQQLQLRHRPVRQHPEETRRPSRGCSRATTTSTAPTRSRSATTSSTRAATSPRTGSVVARHEPADEHHQLPDASPTRTTRFSRTSSRASASGTRCSAR